MTNELEQARRLADEGDVPGAIRALRFTADAAPLVDLAVIMQQLATAADFDDLATAARAVASEPADAKALTVFGYECVERGVSFLAVPFLREALLRAPDSHLALAELVTALEDEYRHHEAAEVLIANESMLRPWPERYLLVYNSILASDLPRARTEFARLTPPDDDRWLFARDRVARMLSRADRVEPISALDHHDLRGWHFTLTGGYLATLSPYGFRAGMTGRWAYLGDSPQMCRYSLDRLSLILNASGRRPRSVSMLPDRSSAILGLAAGQLLGLPIQPYAPGGTDTVVVAYNLRDLDPDLLNTLRERADGQILYEHATCWTSPPPVSADVSGLLHQVVVEPWAAKQRVDNDPLPADTRREPKIAVDIVLADGTPDTGDDETPPDLDPAFAAFITATRDTWLTGPRTPMNSPGPVRSSHFG
ncbi:hypothetical protein AB0N05_09760 [Nocardia sp. NPDC051030]|uniref:hypothetical protein n=1 Tax=Nocardia sp. NPDC051030 TaxID=3155162 RepID=UPI00342A3E0C